MDDVRKTYITEAELDVCRLPVLSMLRYSDVSCADFEVGVVAYGQ